MTPNAALTRDIVTAGNSLIAVLDEESTALAQVRFGDVSALRERKEEAAASYEAMIKRLAENPTLLDHASPVTRQALTVLKDKLDAASVRNVNALRAAMEMNRRLVDTIATSVNRQRIAASGYTKTGASYAQPQSVGTGEVVPVSLNETL
jgi:hypothetical protein